MLNLNSPIVQNTLQQAQGGFNPYAGSMAPQQQMPYQQQMQPNNMIPFGGIGYNQRPNNGYVFGPVNGGYMPQSPYGMNQYNYNGNYGYGYGYGYNSYTQNIDPFLLANMNENGEIIYNRGMVQQSQLHDIKQRTIELNKRKARMVAGYCNTEIDEDKLDVKFNPDNIENKKIIQEYYSPEIAEHQRMGEIVKLLQYPCAETEAMRTARLIHDMSANFHKMYDGMGLCEFLEDHLWRFQREWWIEENIDMRSSRDLSKQYQQKQYMDLLNMHRSSNPYINDLLSNSKYDNNMDDMEIGLPSVLLTAEQRRRQILEGPVPQFISSAETQKKRNEFFSQLTGMVAAKQQGVGNNV